MVSKKWKSFISTSLIALMGVSFLTSCSAGSSSPIFPVEDVTIEESVEADLRAFQNSVIGVIGNSDWRFSVPQIEDCEDSPDLINLTLDSSGVINDYAPADAATLVASGLTDIGYVVKTPKLIYDNESTKNQIIVVEGASPAGDTFLLEIDKFNSVVLQSNSHCFTGSDTKEEEVDDSHGEE